MLKNCEMKNVKKNLRPKKRAQILICRITCMTRFFASDKKLELLGEKKNPIYLGQYMSKRILL